jgi:signal transduction histidine kinase
VIPNSFTPFAAPATFFVRLNLRDYALIRAASRLLKTASFRFAALYVAVFAASAFVLGLAVFLAARSSLEQQMDTGVQTETAFLREEYRRDGLDHLRSLIEARGQENRALDYVLQDAAGVYLAGEIPAQPGLRSGWTELTVPSEREADNEPERVRALVSPLDGGLLLAVGDDIHRITEVEEAVTRAFALTVGLAALLGIGGGILLSQAFLARVDAIARTAEAIIGGDLGRRVLLRGTGDDLDRLAGTLNRMLDRISALMDSLRQVSSDVAHDLRTPLSRLYQRLEDAHDHARSVEEYQPAVEGAMREAEALLDTFSALLRIAQVEGASPRSGFRDVDLTVIAESVADAYRPDAEDADHRIDADFSAGIVIYGDHELLTQALANLVENGLRHTPPGTRLSLRLFRDEEGGVVFVITDNGPGVADKDLPRLTHRFYRGEWSRTTVGNGLGLSLVAAVADLHGAKLRLENASPGIRVTLRFPPAPRSPAPSHLPQLNKPAERWRG